MAATVIWATSTSFRMGAFFGVDPMTGVNNYNNGATLPS